MTKKPECECDSHWAEYYGGEHQHIHEIHEPGCEYAVFMLKEQDEADETIRQILWEQAVEEGQFDED